VHIDYNSSELLAFLALLLYAPNESIDWPITPQYNYEGGQNTLGWQVKLPDSSP